MLKKVLCTAVLAWTASTAWAANGIQSKSVTLWKEKGCLLKETRCFNVDIRYQQTNLDWLNRHLEQEVKKSLCSEENKKLHDLKQAVQECRKIIKTELKDMPADSATSQIEKVDKQKFVGQKGHIIQFENHFYEYSGGAHGFGGVAYKNYDANTKKPIHIQDMLLPNAQKKLAAQLKSAYAKHKVFRDMEMKASEIQTFIQEDWAESINEAFAKPDNFTWRKNGILFSFLPYEIGPYAMGQIDLLLPYGELKGVVKPEFLK